MCEECLKIGDDARAYVKEVSEWIQAQPVEIVVPDGLGFIAAKSAAVAARFIDDRLGGEIVGLMIMETCRITFLAGVRQARQEREAPNGEGEMAPVQMVPIERPVSKS